MDICVLSERNILRSPGWQPIYEFEDLLADMTEGRILAPGAHPPLLGRFIRHRRRQVVFDRLPIPADTGGTPKVLFVVVHNPAALRVVTALPGWRAAFDVVAALVIEPFVVWTRPKIEADIDHFFVPNAEDVEPVRARTKKPVSLLASATDVLTHADAGVDRAIDVVSYGRMPESLRRSLQNRFNDPSSGRIYLHSPFGIGTGEGWQLERRLFWKLLKISKVALCFDTTVPGARAMPHKQSLLTPRWFECLAAGCVTAGLRPTESLTPQMLDWEDAIVDLSGDNDEAMAQIEELADDTDRLNMARRRSLGHLLRRHDWRHRIADALAALSLPVPPKLQADLVRLKERADRCHG